MYLLLASVFVGAVLQRVSGIGFAMVVATLHDHSNRSGPGVVLVQICWRHIGDLRDDAGLQKCALEDLFILLPASGVGILYRNLSGVSVSQCSGRNVSAIIMLCMLALSVVAGHLRQYKRNATSLTIAGGLAGSMTVLAGVGACVALTSLKAGRRGGIRHPLWQRFSLT